MSYTIPTLLFLTFFYLVIKHLRFCFSFPSIPGTPASAKWFKLWYLTKTWQGNFEKYDMEAHCGGGTSIPSPYSISCSLVTHMH